MLSFLISAIKIIFLLGFLVLIHEGGHFIVAKMCKVKVNEFAIGFGPTLISKQKGETKYALHLIPLGGFVSLEGEEERSDTEGSFSNTSIPKKIAIVLAGGLVNIIFGLLVYFILISSTAKIASNEVDYTIDNYSAKIAGIESGDKIISIDGNKIKNAYDVNKYLNKDNIEELTISLERNNEIINLKLQPTDIKTKDIGIYFSKNNNKDLIPKIAGIEENSPAKQSGLRENDIIISVNDIDTENDLYKTLELIQKSDTEEIKLELKRNDETIECNVHPNTVNNYYLGVVFKNMESTFADKVSYGLSNTKDFVLSIFDNLKEMFTGKISANQMVGIVGISNIVVNTSGLYEYIYMLALISLSLGLTNLLPFPPLDGGKVVIYLVEAIRRKPMKEELEIKLQMLGFAILIALSIYVTYNDILRIV